MKDALIVSALSIVPRKRGAWLMGWFARTRLSRLIVRIFVRVYGLNMDEASEPIEAYPTLEALFTRTLKPEARPVDTTDKAMVSPVDGCVAAVGTSKNGKVRLTDEKSLDLSSLLGTQLDDEHDAVVIYLSPKDYHRVHSPIDGNATRWAYLPGTLWPVFPAAVRRVQDLFSKNERALVHLDTDQGPIEVVLIGAFGVGRISLSCADIITNTDGKARDAILDPGVVHKRGEHLGTFHLGSTVVLMVPKNTWTWSISVGDTVRMGRRIGMAR